MKTTARRTHAGPFVFRILDGAWCSAKNLFVLKGLPLTPSRDSGTLMNQRRARTIMSLMRIKGGEAAGPRFLLDTADGHPFFDLPGPELLWGSDAMTKSELIQRLSEINPHLYHRDVERIVTTIFDEITDALARGDRVELRGFGAFSVKQRDARTGRNPRTGAAVQVAEKRIPFFKTGKLLRERLNNIGQQ